MAYASKSQDRQVATLRNLHGAGLAAQSTTAKARTQLARNAAAAEELPFAALFYWVD